MDKRDCHECKRTNIFNRKYYSCKWCPALMCEHITFGVNYEGKIMGWACASCYMPWELLQKINL